MAVPNIFAGTAGGTTAQLDANFAYFADAISVSGGNVLLGTTSNYRAGKLVLKATNGTLVSTQANFHVSTTDAAGIDLGGSLALGGMVDGSNEAPFGYIAGRKENATSGSFAGYLQFGVLNASATAVEVMRFDSSGNQINKPSNTPPSLTVNGQMNMTPTSNTNMRVSYRGSDGVTRVANITLA
jgi:hypothetical protein